MTTNSNPNRVSQFILEIGIDQANVVADALASVGIGFDPRSSVIGLVTPQGLPGHVTGDNILDVIVPINRHLREQGDGRCIVEKVSGMSLSGMEGILSFGANRCAWLDTEDGLNVIAIDPESWEEFAAQFPDLVELSTES